MIQKIAVTKVTKRFGATAALRGVTVEFGPGLTVIEGPNGSGKSTLLGIIGGTIAPTSGTVSYPPITKPNEIRAHLGWVSHDSLCYADLSGRQNIEMAARIHGFPADEAWTEAEQRFGLGGFAKRKLRGNSRGQKQRIALARALVHRPQVVLLDEPTTGLDKAGVDRLLAVIQEEVDDGKMWLVITHEPEIFRSLEPRSFRLERGQAVSE